MFATICNTYCIIKCKIQIICLINSQKLITVNDNIKIIKSSFCFFPPNYIFPLFYNQTLRSNLIIFVCFTPLINDKGHLSELHIHINTIMINKSFVFKRILQFDLSKGGIRIMKELSKLVYFGTHLLYYLFCYLIMKV